MSLDASIKKGNKSWCSLKEVLVLNKNSWLPINFDLMPYTVAIVNSTDISTLTNYKRNLCLSPLSRPQHTHL